MREKEAIDDLTSSVRAVDDDDVGSCGSRCEPDAPVDTAVEPVGRSVQGQWNSQNADSVRSACVYETLDRREVDDEYRYR